MNAVESLFKDYIKTVHKGAPISKIQLDECRKAFFAGAMGTLILTSKAALKSEESAVRILNGVENEIREFAESVKLEWLKTN